MSFLKWVERGRADSGSGRPPMPPPRDPTGINSIVHAHVLGSGEAAVEEEEERAFATSCGAESSRSRSGPDRETPAAVLPACHSEGRRRPSSEDFAAESDSSRSSSPSSYLDARSKKQRQLSRPNSMEESAVHRASPLRAVVTPTTVDRNRCSTYDNLDDAFASGSSAQVTLFAGKPPAVSCPTSRSSRSAISRNSPVQVDHFGAPSARHRSSPVPRHCSQQALNHHDSYSVGGPAHRQSPSFVSRSAAPSPSCARYGDHAAVCSGRSTPTVKYRAMGDDDHHRNAWRDSDSQADAYQDCDSTDSDAVRRRTPSGCKAPRSHRGSLPPSRECHGSGGGGGGAASWHQSACYSCVPSSPRCHHWHGTVPPSPTFAGCCGGYAMHTTVGQGCSHDDFEQRVYQMESEKEHLILQVSCLTEQVEAQNEKIQELEVALREKKDQLNHSEQMLNQEMESRSSLEDSKLDLLSQISALRIKVATVEQQRQELEEKNSKLESELVLTCACLAEKDAELSLLKSKLARNGTVTPTPEQDSEIHKLKNALSSVIAANDEKENKIRELKTSLNRYKRLQELVLSDHSRKASEGPWIHGNVLGTDSSLDLSYEISDSRKESATDEKLSVKPPPVPRTCLQPLASSSPTHESMHGLSMRESQSLRCSPILKANCNSLPLHSSNALSQRARSSDNVIPLSKTPPAKRHYGTIPRQHGNDVLLQIHHQLQQHRLESSSNSSSLDRSVGVSTKKASQSSQNLHHPGLDTFRQSRSKPSGISFGKGFFRLRSGKRSTSAPELVPQDIDEGLELPDTVHSRVSNIRRSSSPVKITNEKPKGIKRIFGRLKRTGSENLNANAAEFKRGGIRATTGPRFGWGEDSKSFNNLNVPFVQWSCSMICDWMHSLGLGMYANECRKWVKNADQLLKAKSSDLEKELGIKNPLHRKKLLLAISGAKGSDKESYQKVDHHWIVRWLDDIGLPQYKDAFFDARVDGSVLNFLTVEDLFHLKVTNQLHHISIKTGIQVLRENDFSPQCLTRRAVCGDSASPKDVSLWSNHRIMEWLQTVDLSEYAPNLRGSGVHGGVMVYEPRFNADLLATLLNIPPSKTLLRRHLSTQFTQLVGSELMQKKREWEAQSGYIPLSPSAKVKVVRRGQLSFVRKRTKAEVDFEDYVCPMGTQNKASLPLSKENDSKAVPAEKEQPQNILNKEDRKIPLTLEEEANAAVNALDDLLKDENVFRNLTATNV